MIEYFVFAAIGRLIIFLLQKFPFQKLPWIGNWWKEGHFLEELFSCDLCLGVWVYSILSVIYRYNIVPYFYIPVFSWVVTGMMTSFIVHVFTNGWKALYNVTVIGGE